ncbi:MAG: hypothetical protein GQ582_10315 [Methyloprofundus sp.]|nr:hypothetical protein [Methyloprofundus sp.]
MGFLSGIFSSKKTTKKVYQEFVVTPSEDGVTGVAKYLTTQADKPVEPSNYKKKLSGVGEYIESHDALQVELSSAEKEEINTRIKANIELRKTEESLMSAENEELSGVAKYVESQEQAAKAALEAAGPVTGVAKYITNIVENKPATTGVAKYLQNRADAVVSSVDRYVINKKLADKNKPEVVIIPESGVSKYLKGRPTLSTSSVAKYLAKQAVASKQAAA